jgi:hypothetical protein
VIRLIVRMIAVGAVAVTISCGSATRTVWSTEVRSPDGTWLARAQTDQTSGPGNAFVWTGVYLNRASGARSSETILGFPNEVRRENGAIDVALVWVTPDHLEVILSKWPKFDVQVIKYAGIDISVKQGAILKSNDTG